MNSLGNDCIDLPKIYGHAHSESTIYNEYCENDSL